MGKGYAEGPAAEERFAALERGDNLPADVPEERQAVYARICRLDPLQALSCSK